MATGFLFNGQCFKAPDVAHSAFRAQFPKFDGAGVVSLLSSSADSSGIAYNVTFSSASGPLVTQSGLVAFAPCDTQDSTTVDRFQELLAPVLFVFFFAFFMRKAFRKAAHFMGGMQSDF